VPWDPAIQRIEAHGTARPAPVPMTLLLLVYYASIPSTVCHHQAAEGTLRERVKCVH